MLVLIQRKNPNFIIHSNAAIWINGPCKHWCLVGVIAGNSLWPFWQPTNPNRIEKGSSLIWDSELGTSGPELRQGIRNKLIIGSYSPFLCSTSQNEILATNFFALARLSLALQKHPWSITPAQLKGNGVFSTTTLNIPFFNFILDRQSLDHLHLQWTIHAFDLVTWALFDCPAHLSGDPCRLLGTPHLRKAPFVDQRLQLSRISIHHHQESASASIAHISRRSFSL